MKVQKRWIFIFLAPTAILFLLIYTIPLLMTFYTSLFDYRLYPKRFNFIGIANYIDLFTQNKAFTHGFINTVVWILMQCSLHVGLGIILALVLYKKPFGWKFVRASYMIPNIISNATIAMIFLNIFNPSFGVLNSVLKTVGFEEMTRNWLFENKTAFMSVSCIWILFAGYTTTLILAEALSIDMSVIEAAKIDGVTNFQMDLLVVLPLLRRIIATTIIMGASYMLQMFDLIYIATKGGPGTTTTNLPLLLYSVSTSENNYGYANAIGVVIIVLGFLVMLAINGIFKTNDMDY